MTEETTQLPATRELASDIVSQALVELIGDLPPDFNLRDLTILLLASKMSYKAVAAQPQVKIGVSMVRRIVDNNRDIFDIIRLKRGQMLGKVFELSQINGAIGLSRLAAELAVQDITVPDKYSKNLEKRFSILMQGMTQLWGIRAKIKLDAQGKTPPEDNANLDKQAADSEHGLDALE